MCFVLLEETLSSYVTSFINNLSLGFCYLMYNATSMSKDVICQRKNVQKESSALWKITLCPSSHVPSKGMCAWLVYCNYL